MFFENINYWTVVISAVVSMGLGFVWYSPYLFGNRFMKEMGMTPEKMAELEKGGGKESMGRTYAISALMSLVTAFIIASLLNSLIVASLGGLALIAALVWLAFSMPISANHVMFGNDSFELFLINTGYQLVSILLATFIIGIWG